MVWAGAARYGGVVPPVAGGPGSLHVKQLTEKVAPLLEQYLEAMEAIRIREAARTLLEISACGNKYLQVRSRGPPSTSRGSLRVPSLALVMCLQNASSAAVHLGFFPPPPRFDSFDHLQAFPLFRPFWSLHSTPIPSGSDKIQ